MASIKAKKGNPFEKKIAYNLQKAGYKVMRPDDNTSGIDLVAFDPDNSNILFIECKFQQKFTFDELIITYFKTQKTAQKMNKKGKSILVFTSNLQPPLILSFESPTFIIKLFTDYFNCNFDNVPKGYKICLDKYI